MKFSTKNFYSKCDQIRWKLWIWSHLLKKPFMENFIFCAVNWRNVMKIKKLSDFLGSLGILIFPVFIYSTNLILWKSFIAQYDESRSMFSKLKCGLQAISALATGAGIDYVIVQLYFGQSIEMFEPFNVNYPAWMDVFSVELPVLFQQNVFLCLLSLNRFCACYKIPSLYFHLFIDSLKQTVLQHPGPLMAVYFPILNPTYSRSSPP